MTGFIDTARQTFRYRASSAPLSSLRLFVGIVFLKSHLPAAEIYHITSSSDISEQIPDGICIMCTKILCAVSELMG